MYPGTTSKPKGKLRLLYECNPFAFIVEKAGGVATNGIIPILDIQPTELHERTPFFIGSKLMMEEMDQYYRAPSISPKGRGKAEDVSGDQSLQN